MKYLTINYTALENQVIEAIKMLLSNGQELIYIGDLEMEGFDTKKVRGALSSLVQKHAIDINKRDGGLISLLLD